MINKTISMGKISYINASPVYYGLDRGMLPGWLKMLADVPTVLNEKILTGDIKVSPISAAAYAMNHKALMALPDLSISCHGPVLSVLLASDFPIEDLSGKTVIFSRESASAASFLKMIFNQKQIIPNYQVAPVFDAAQISTKADAVLVIGDTALTQPWDKQFRYCFDLGEIWYEMTQLPFVFAVWVVQEEFARKHPETTREIHNLLLASKDEGYRHIDEIIKAGQEKLDIGIDVVARYFDLLLCDLDEKKIKAMSLFFESLYEQNVIREKAQIRFFQ